MGNYPRICLHQDSGQPDSCLEGLVRYARRAAAHPRAGEFGGLDEFVSWSLSQPVKFDEGEEPTIAGCDPRQRSVIWPEDGLNCWEATGLALAVAMRLALPLQFHVFDVDVNGQRHVFPGVRPLGDCRQPEALVLQPPVGIMPDRSAVAQAWYNDLLGWMHTLGRPALKVTGGYFLGPEGAELGDELADKLEEFEDPALPEWAKTRDAEEDLEQVPEDLEQVPDLSQRETAVERLKRQMEAEQAELDPDSAGARLRTLVGDTAPSPELTRVKQLLAEEVGDTRPNSAVSRVKRLIADEAQQDSVNLPADCGCAVKRSSQWAA